MYWILFLLACAGLTSVLTKSKLFEEFRSLFCKLQNWRNNWFTRKLAYMVHCSACVGLHCGWAMYLLFALGGIELFPVMWLGVILAAFISSLTSYWAAQVVDDSGIRLEIKK